MLFHRRSWLEFFGISRGFVVLLVGLTGFSTLLDCRAGEVWVSGQEGYHTYRIPSVLRTKAGTLLAFCEGRKDKARDTGRIELLEKRSTDGGATWSSASVIWADGPNTCGNPCPVVDRSTGTIWFLGTHNLGTEPESKIEAGEASEGRTVWVLNSTDDGRTWSKPVNITADTKRPDWRWYATGPGVGIQLSAGPHAGRLVIPCDFSLPPGPGPDGKVQRVGGSHVIYSDDHGAHWQIGGTLSPQMNESQAAELPDGKGTLVISMRANTGRHRRGEAFSSDGGTTWTAPADVPDLLEPVCQGSIITFHPAAGPALMLFSNPSNEKRRMNLTVHASVDGAQTWPRSLVLNPGFSAYSCLVQIDGTHAGCLFENGTRGAYERISFASFAVDAITVK